MDVRASAAHDGATPKRLRQGSGTTSRQRGKGLETMIGSQARFLGEGGSKKRRSQDGGARHINWYEWESGWGG